jgi:hypothetical protein
MKHLLVHIGTGKTGSTAIQQALLQSAQQLRAQGVHYWGLNLEGVDSPDPFPWQKESGTPDLQKLSDAVASQQLSQAVNRALEQLPDGATAVWSNESIYERPGAYLSWLQGLQSETVRCTVVAYARSHSDYISSAYKQWGIKHKTYRGPILGFSDWVLARREFLSYGLKLAHWDTAFADHFRLVNYDVINDVVEDFSRFLPESARTLSAGPRRVNRSPDPAILALYALHNSQYAEPVTPSAMLGLLRQFPKLRQLQPLPSLASLFPNTEQIQTAEDVLREDGELVNAMLRRHGQPLLQHSQSTADESTLIPEQITADLLAAMMHMLTQQNERIVQLEQALNNREKL